MVVRSKRLPRNHSAGCSDEKPLRTVHHRPPKNIAPSKAPVTRATTRLKPSFIIILLLIRAHFLVFLIHPMPCIQTSNGQADDQQHQRPGMVSRMAIVQPDTKRRAEQRRNHHRPADQPHHAQTKPDALVGLACPELACRLRADLPAKRSPIFGALGFRLFTHGETPLSGGQNRSPFSPSPSGRLVPVRSSSETPARLPHVVGPGPCRQLRCARR